MDRWDVGEEVTRLQSSCSFGASAHSGWIAWHGECGACQMPVHVVLSCTSALQPQAFGKYLLKTCCYRICLHRTPFAINRLYGVCSGGQMMIYMLNNFFFSALWRNL